MQTKKTEYTNKTRNSKNEIPQPYNNMKSASVHSQQTEIPHLLQRSHSDSPRSSEILQERITENF